MLVAPARFGQESVLVVTSGVRQVRSRQDRTGHVHLGRISLLVRDSVVWSTCSWFSAGPDARAVSKADEAGSSGIWELQTRLLMGWWRQQANHQLHGLALTAKS